MVNCIFAVFTASVTELKKTRWARQSLAMARPARRHRINVHVEARRGGPFVEVGLAELQSLVRQMCYEV